MGLGMLRPPVQRPVVELGAMFNPGTDAYEDMSDMFGVAVQLADSTPLFDAASVVDTGDADTFVCILDLEMDRSTTFRRWTDLWGRRSLRSIGRGSAGLFRRWLIARSVHRVQITMRRAVVVLGPGTFAGPAGLARRGWRIVHRHSATESHCPAGHYSWLYLGRSVSLTIDRLFRTVTGSPTMPSSITKTVNLRHYRPNKYTQRHTDTKIHMYTREITCRDNTVACRRFHARRKRNRRTLDQKNLQKKKDTRLDVTNGISYAQLRGGNV